MSFRIFGTVRKGIKTEIAKRSAQPLKHTYTDNTLAHLTLTLVPPLEYMNGVSFVSWQLLFGETPDLWSLLVHI